MPDSPEMFQQSSPDLGFFEVASSAMLERGLTTPEQVHAERSALHLELGMEPPPALPGAAPAQAPAPSAVLGSEPAPVPVEDAPAVDPMWDGPATPAGYLFDRPQGAPPVDPTSELAFRTFLHDEGIPAGIAREVDRLATKGAAAKLTPDQRNQSYQQCMAQLSNLWGDQRDANLAIARGELARMCVTRPELAAIIKETNLTNSPWMAFTLVNLAKGKGRVRG